ncbi:hypothetical protein JZ751_008756 [Albula glossodonta]|uniref:Uncharacterized protein n=1 Tax=Albula glossodonta TaxID=121402 RepID=A0A8T2P7L7_9TELE|nr:hypothetical protein JZ751_008756 [Albula glossodonta]
MRELRGALGGAAPWGDCALGVLTHLMKLQDAEVQTLIQDLQEALLHNVQDGMALVQNADTRQETRNHVEGEQGRRTGSSNRRDLCSACGHTLAQEEIPYLEILHARNNQEEPHEERRANENGEEDRCDVPRHFEKQGSLITLAWGKPSEDTNNQEVSDALVEQAAPCLEQEEVVAAAHLQMAPEDPCEDEASGSAFFQCSPRAAQHHDQPDQGDTSTGKDPVDDDGQLTQETHEGRTHPRRRTDNDTESVSSEYDQHARDIQPQQTEENISTGRSSPGGHPSTCETVPADDVDEDSNQTMKWSSKEMHPDRAKGSIIEECSGNAKHFQEQPVEEAPSEKTRVKGFQREATVIHISEMEREETMKSLVDMQRKVESKHQRDKERQMFRIQERLSIVQNKKSDEDLLGHRQGESLKELTEKFKQEDRHRQKTLVKEKLEQLRRERSHVMQSKRDRNTSGFKELLDPVVLNRAEHEDSMDSKY